MLNRRQIERTFHLTKLTLLEVAPLFPFLLGRYPLHCIEVHLMQESGKGSQIIINDLFQWRG